MKKKTYFWHDPVNDDFGNTNIKADVIKDDFKYYSRSPFYLFFESLIRTLVIPLVWMMVRIGFLYRTKNRKVLRKARGKGYFLYINHTNYLLDAYVPSLVGWPRKTHIITLADAASIKLIRPLVMMLGDLPIPSTIKGLINLKDSVEKMATQYKRVIAIYPEAHLWPYYNDIRPFGKQSFHYPVDTGLPTYSVTNIYLKRKLKLHKKPKVISYIDGPFYPDSTLPKAEQVQNLRDQVYAAMKKRVDENPKYDYYDYIYVDDEKLITKAGNHSKVPEDDSGDEQKE